MFRDAIKSFHGAIYFIFSVLPTRSFISPNCRQTAVMKLPALVNNVNRYLAGSQENARENM